MKYYYLHDRMSRKRIKSIWQWCSEPLWLSLLKLQQILLHSLVFLAALLILMLTEREEQTEHFILSWYKFHLYCHCCWIEPKDTAQFNLMCPGKFFPLTSLHVNTLFFNTLHSYCTLSKRNTFWGTPPYLSVQHLATSQVHRLCKWIHPEQIHSLCKQCKSSSSSLLLSWSPEMQNIPSATILYKTAQSFPQ